MSATPGGEFRPILRLIPFRLLWLSQMLALTAQNGIHFVQIVLIEHLTGRSLHTGLMIVAFSIPPVLLSFLAGVVIDRVPKKWIISASNITRALLAFAYLLILTGWQGTALLWAVYVITFLASGIGAFNNPAVLAKLPLVVGEERLVTANSLFNLTIAVSQVLGLIILAPLAVKVVGISGGFALMGVLYLLAFIFDFFLPRDHNRRVIGVTASLEWRHLVSEVTDGWRFVIRNQAVMLALVQLILVNTLLMILVVLAPGFSARVLGLAPEDAVVVFAPASVGMLAAMFFLGRWGSRISAHWLQTGVLMLTAVGFALLGFVSRDYNSLRIPIFDVYPQRILPLTTTVAAIALLLGFGIYAIITLAQSSIQHRTPPLLRGRVFTVQFMITNLVGTLPLLAAASVADWLGIPEMMRWLAIGCVLVGLLSLYAILRGSAASEQPSGRTISEKGRN